MDFQFKKNYAGNEKPLMQHVQGDVLTEWRVADDRNGIVQESRRLEADATGPRAGTFFLGGMLTTRDELAEYVLEASERNTAPRPNRLPEIQRKIEVMRERHAEAIRWGVRQKQAGVRLPKAPVQRPKRYLLLPKAVGMVGPAGEMLITEVR